jgi:hypothetical protein
MVPFDGSYSKYDRLANLLRASMSAGEAGKILGEPETQESLSGGLRWTFSDTESTADWICVADFSPGVTNLQLSYFLNLQHRAFTNSLHREFGTPVDGGEFRSDPFLKMRRDQWRRIAPPN